MALHGNSAVQSQLPDQVSDAASELLVAKLALNDIAAIRATRKGKVREDAPPSDEEVAFDLQAASLDMFVTTLHDHRFASSVDLAIESDAAQLGRLVLLERAELDDHRAAVALRDGHDVPWQTASQRMMERVAAQPARAPRPTHQQHTSNTTDADMEVISTRMENIHTTTPAASRTVHHQSVKRVECVICGDDVVANRSFEAPCTHHYCPGCLINLVETALRDESLYPLRCCKEPLPLWSFFRFISSSLRFQFLEKSREYATPAASRLYCCNPTCSEFLGASGDGKSNVTCSKCKTVSCSQCKNAAHPGKVCAEQQSMLELRAMAAVNKWQTCPGCHAIVELVQGCYHITCRCLTQFCYLCSARWKTCKCEQWDETLLLNDAERRVRNEYGDRTAAARPVVHVERVHRQMEMLRESHECEVHFWRYRHGPGRCEECGSLLPIFLMRCVRCQTLVCKRCSVNRL